MPMAIVLVQSLQDSEFHFNLVRRAASGFFLNANEEKPVNDPTLHAKCTERHCW
jgi:hypothetical protein